MKTQQENVKLLNLLQAADLLNTSTKTLHRMIRKNEVPAFKLGGQWRFRESTLRMWIDKLEEGKVQRY